MAEILGSSLEFVPEIFWAESVHDLIGHNGTIKHDKLLSAKEVMRSVSLLIKSETWRSPVYVPPVGMGFWAKNSLNTGLFTTVFP